MKPSVNSTSQPYFYPDNVEDCEIPCFTYIYKNKEIGSTSGVQYSIESDELYTEPEVWEVKGASKTLVNYKFAFGNRISDAEDNPFSISTEGKLSSGSASDSPQESAAYGSPSAEIAPSADIAP